MSKSFDQINTVRKDLVSSVILWLIAEFVAFVLFPLFQLIRVEMQMMWIWFLNSLLFGFGGIALMATASWLLIGYQSHHRSMKILSPVLAGIAGGLALAGILYPLWAVCLQLFINGLPGE